MKQYSSKYNVSLSSVNCSHKSIELKVGGFWELPICSQLVGSIGCYLDLQQVSGVGGRQCYGTDFQEDHMLVRLL